MNEEEREAYDFFKEKRELFNKWVEEKTASDSDIILAQYYNSFFGIIEKQQKEIERLEEVIDMMAEKLVRVPENDFMSEAQLSVVRFINLHIEEKKEHIKAYYFNKVKEKANDK